MLTAAVPSLSGQALAREFEDIFREHCQFVYRTAYSLTGSRPDAEDIVQNIFLKLIQRELPSGLRENPKAYLLHRAPGSVERSTGHLAESRESAGKISHYRPR